MPMPSSRCFVATVLAISLCAWLTPDVAAQDAPIGKPQLKLPQHPADGKIDPQLLLDAQQLATNGFVREGDHVRPDLRVVIEIARQPGDVTFETSTARDPLADVQAAVINRQALFLGALDGALTAVERGGVRILFPLELQYMLAAEVVDLKALRALAAAPGIQYVWKDKIVKPLTIEGRTLTGSTTQANAGYTGAGVGVAVIDGNFDLLHPELGGSTALPNSVVKGGYNYSAPGAAIHSQTWGDCSHGTACASIVRRYAPGCHLYTLVIFPAAFSSSWESIVANAINWCVVNKYGTGGGSPIKVISMSFGTVDARYVSPVTSGPVHTACGTALANGILCFAASGNEGWTDAMDLPAASTNCISVGATWDANLASYTGSCSDPNPLVDERTCYSNTASFLSIYCPSEEVICASCGGSTFAFGGTSAACPAAAGLTAQLLHARPNFAGTLSGLVNLYQSTGATVTGDTSKRRVNLTAAIAGAVGPTGRTMHVLAPPLIGQTGTFSMTYPVSAAGNIYVFLWSAPPTSGVTPIVVPGMTVNGFARVNPLTFAPAFSGLLGWAGSVVHSVTVPNHPSWIGYAWDLQSVDLGTFSNTLTFADNKLVLRVSGTISPNMVPIAAGSFQMGSATVGGTAVPVHTVTITRPFWMDKYELTQVEYQAVMGSNPSGFQGANRPVETVTWHDAMTYCTVRTVQEAAAGRLPTGYQYRLPTEAEWEYCCRAGTTTEWNVGSSLSCGEANFYGCVGQTMAVGNYAANAWGLHDMHGNVLEWCLDSGDPFGPNNYPASAVSDPYVTSGPFRVFRGGSWDGVSISCRSAVRSMNYSGNGYGNLGFRVVLAPVLIP